MWYCFHSGKWPMLLQEHIRMGLLKKFSALSPSSPRRRWQVWGKARQGAGHERTVLWLWYPKCSPQEQLLHQSLLWQFPVFSPEPSASALINLPVPGASPGAALQLPVKLVYFSIIIDISEKLLTQLWPGPFAVFQRLPGHSWQWPRALLASAVSWLRRANVVTAGSQAAPCQLLVGPASSARHALCTSTGTELTVPWKLCLPQMDGWLWH